MYDSGRLGSPLGLVGGAEGGSFAVRATLAVLCSIALYNALELAILILLTFHSYKGLYFWSLLLSVVVGVIPTAVGNVLHFFTVGPLSLALVLSNIGFYFMIPGQSFVLYSRLHLVLRNSRLLRFLLYLISIDGAMFGILTTTTTFGSAFARTYPWNRALNIAEPLQVTWFCAQEFLLSSIYIWETLNLLRLCPKSGSHRKQIMYQLLAINSIMILIDICLVVMEYVGLYYLQVTLKSVFYSIKLKFEFAVLGKLASMTGRNDHDESTTIDTTSSDFPDFVHPDYAGLDFSHAKRIDERTEPQNPRRYSDLDAFNIVHVEDTTPEMTTPTLSEKWTMTPALPTKGV